MNEIQRFILDEMRIRGLSQRQFADHVGVSNATISRIVDQSQPMPAISVETLVKMSRATNTSILKLIEMAYPEIAETTRGPAPSVEVLAQRIEQLSPEHQRMVMAIVNDWLAEREPK